MRHIKSKLPALYGQINNLLAAKKRELERYGVSLRTDTTEDRELVLFEMVSRYMEEFLALLHGTSDRLSATGLDGGSRVVSALIDEFPQRMLSIPSVKEIPLERVANLIHNGCGIRQSMFFPEQSFSILVKREINKLRKCVMDCIAQVQRIVVEMHNAVQVPELTRWKALRDQIITIAQESVAAAAKEAAAYTATFLDVQISYINTDHPDFKGKADPAAAGKKDNVQQLVELTHHYYVIVRKEIIDAIPKAIYRLMLDKGVDGLRLELVEKLVIPGQLFEDSIVAEKRRNCAALIKALEQASTVLTDVRKTHV
jgi:hypothetical protein